MVKTPRYKIFNGFPVPPSFEEEVFFPALAYKPVKGDVIVSTYPKCGTTWTQQIVLLILTKGRPPKDTADYFGLLPFLEVTEIEKIQQMPRPACLKIHLPFDMINFSKDAKYIYVARNPADCVVSFYHHTRYFSIYCFSDGTFDDFFETFIKGETDFGDYFDNLLSWYEHRNEPNLLFLTFEDIKMDHRSTILKIARFLGEEYYDSLFENDEEVLKNVLKYSSLDYMKETINVYWGEAFINGPPEELQEQSIVAKSFAKALREAEEKGHYSIGEFVRKGDTGDGKITLSKDQMDKLNERIKKKTSHSDVMDLWKKKV